VHEFFNVPRPHVLAHRGFARDVPENSLAAFEQALALGATHIETDAQGTRDGVAVLFHDDDIDGVAISDMLASELPAHVPTLAAALEGFPQARFNIDIKSPRAVELVPPVVNAAGAADRVLVTSFSEARRRATAEQIPGVATSASSSRFACALIFAKIGFQPGVRWALRSLDAVQIPEQGAGMRTVNPRLIRSYQRAGVLVDVWTVNEPSDMRRLINWGVDGIVTDRTDLAAAVVREG
jgi:glycerophosphoryl diester phosphodiesterase